MKKRLVALSLLVMTLVSGCAKMPEKIVLTTGFAKDEVFRIDDSSCSLSELMVYLVNTQDEYSNSLGTQIWEVSADGDSLGARVKDSVLARIAQVKSMNLLAQSLDVSLTDEEDQLAKQAAKEYYESLSEEEIEAMNNLDQATVEKLYREFALANKVYAYTIQDINPEISDDEARTITVEQILIKTYSTNADGSRSDFSDTQKAGAYKTAQECLSQISDTVSFEQLIGQYNEADSDTISFGKGEVDSRFEEAAFSLDNDEISGIVETDDGYRLIKCISTFDRDQTEANKVRIVAKKRREAFGEQYNAFVKTLTRDLNDKLFAEITIVPNENIKTADFFDVYYKYFEKTDFMSVITETS